MRHEVTRYHDFSAGHRVVGHEGKCAFLHGHNYRVHFTCVAGSWGGIGVIQMADRPLDHVGRVIDFSAIKSLLCQWLEDNWDHRFLVWRQDDQVEEMCGLDATVVVVPFNPTAENIAEYLVTEIGPRQLEGTGIVLASVTVEETRKCRASFAL